jgi:cAMP phosphodiesterase
MRIKVTSLATLHQKERDGLQKKKSQRELRAKSSSVQKKESEKKKSNHALSKNKLEKGNFSKEYHFHQIYHTHAHLDQLV